LSVPAFVCPAFARERPFLLGMVWDSVTGFAFFFLLVFEVATEVGLLAGFEPFVRPVSVRDRLAAIHARILLSLFPH
jgi:hypothetical protein